MNNYSGQRFGNLVALNIIGRDKHRNVLWQCKCDCGNTSVVAASDLKKTKSCGCLKAKSLIERNTTHGQSKSHLYKVWAGMKQRCENPSSKRYLDYGGRGISLCSEWRNFISFFEWAKTHGYQVGLDIDRIDNNGNYSPENCRFVTRAKNNRNKRSNAMVEFSGSVKPLVEWSEQFGIDPKIAWKRLNRGWSAEETFLLPVGTRKRYKTPEELARLKEEWK